MIPPVDGQPHDGHGPVFEAPWQAQAFAMAVALHERGVFAWPEWADRLSHEIEQAQIAGDPDHGETYYLHWLAALEGLAIDRGVVSIHDLVDRKQAWDRAARATPHGKPILLGADISSGAHAADNELSRQEQQAEHHDQPGAGDFEPLR